MNSNGTESSHDGGREWDTVDNVTPERSTDVDASHVTGPSVLWHVEAGEGPERWNRPSSEPTIDIDIDHDHDHDLGLPRHHPGIHDSFGGYRAHRVNVHFRLQRATETQLKLSFAADRGPVPDLEVVVDGKYSGLFHPDVVRDGRSATDEPGPTAGTCEITVVLPSTWMLPGSHTISVRTVFDEAAALGSHASPPRAPLLAVREELPPARSNYADWFGSYIRWQSITLSEAPGPALPPSIVIRPTPFFVELEGKLHELIDVDVNWAPGQDAARGLVLTTGATRVEIPDAPNERSFGTWRSRIPIPEFVGQTTMRVDNNSVHLSTIVTASRKWTLHLTPHVHLDVGFTDYQTKAIELHCRNIDRALDQFEVNPRFRFNIDGSFIVEEYFRTRSPKQSARLRKAVEAGKLAVNALHSNLLTGIASQPELVNALSFGLRLPVSERTGLRYANLTDVPTATNSLPSILSSVGISGFVGMSNHHRASTSSSDLLHLLSPVRWQGPDGSEVLAHFADHYSQLRFMAADPQSVGAATDGLSRFLRRYDREDYLPNDLAVIGTHADNEDLADGDTGFVERWNSIFSWPRFVVSTFDEYLASVLPLSENLPVWTGEMGTYWEDQVGSAANVYATYRQTQVELPAAETLASLVSAMDDKYRPNTAEFERAWAGLSIAAEHTLTWAHATIHPHAAPVDDQFSWKSQFVEGSHRVAIDETRRSLSQLAEIEGLAGPGILAYNPLPWASDLNAEFDLLEDANIVDASGEIVQVETLESCNGLRRCRTTFGGVPAFSYRYFPITKAKATAPAGESDSDIPSAAKSGRSSAESPDLGFETLARNVGWAIDLDEKSTLPRSLRHLASGRELIDQSASFGLGQVIRLSAEDLHEDSSHEMVSPSSVHTHHRALTKSLDSRLSRLPDSGSYLSTPRMEFVGASATFDGVRLRWSGGDDYIEGLSVDLILTKDEFELSVSFDKPPVLGMESVSVSFPFAGDRLLYDRQLGWVEPSKSHQPGASNEWFTATNSVYCGDGVSGIVWTPIDSALFSVGDIVRGRWPSSPAKSCQLFSFVMNNYWPCNTPPTQSGRFTGKYSVKVVDRFDPAEASRVGRSARTYAQTVEITALDRFTPNRPATYRQSTLLKLKGDPLVDVRFETKGEARMMMHLSNLTAAPLRIDLPVVSGWSTDGIPEPANITLAPFGLVQISLVRN